MQNPIVPIEPSFDVSILAGTKSPNTIAQYAMHFRAYLAFAGSFAAAVEPSTLARWRQELYQTGYTRADGTVHPYSVSAINQRLAAVRSLMAEAAQQGYIPHETAEAFKHVKSLSLVANKERRKTGARTAITRADMQRITAAPDASTLAGKMHRALLMTLAMGGMRITEAVTLRQEQIQWGEDDDGRQGGWSTSLARTRWSRNPVRLVHRRSEPSMNGLQPGARSALNRPTSSPVSAGGATESRQSVPSTG